MELSTLGNLATIKNYTFLGSSDIQSSVQDPIMDMKRYHAYMIGDDSFLYSLVYLY